MRKIPQRPPVSSQSGSLDVPSSHRPDLNTDIDLNKWSFLQEYKTMENELKKLHLPPPAYLKLDGTATRTDGLNFKNFENFEHLIVNAELLYQPGEEVRRRDDKFFSRGASTIYFTGHGELFHDIVHNNEDPNDSILCKLKGKDLDSNLANVEWVLGCIVSNKTDFTKWTLIELLDLIQMFIAKGRNDFTEFCQGGYSTAIND